MTLAAVCVALGVVSSMGELRAGDPDVTASADICSHGCSDKRQTSPKVKRVAKLAFLWPLASIFVPSKETMSFAALTTKVYNLDPFDRY